MPKHSEIRTMPFSAAQMYALVAEVEKYPEFLPWCAAARVRSEKQIADSTVLAADLVISFKVFRERFGSTVTLWPAKNAIHTKYLDGPFKYLHSHWVFTDNGAGCDVDFAVDFEFKNAILQKIIGVVFDQAMHRIVRAFEDRAHELYDEG